VPPRRLATQAAKQLRAFTHAGGAARAATTLDRAPRSTSVTVAGFIQPVLWFCKIRPNFELKTKFHQNESCAEFYKLQNSFW